MKGKSDLLIIVIMFCTTIYGFGQDSAIVLEGPVIRDSLQLKHNNFTSPFLSYRSTSKLGLAGSLADGYFFSNQMQFTSYGPGMLATLGSSGLASAHTKISWNDVLLNSPLNGVVDLSTLPVFMLDQVANHLGSSATGNADFESKVSPHGSNVEAALSYGSFNTRSLGLSGSLSGTRLKGQLDIYHEASDNDYNYLNDLGESMSLNNADYNKWHYKGGLSYDISERSAIKAQVWMAEQENNTPPSIYQNESNANQELDFTRISLAYVLRNPRFELNIDQGYTRDDLHYFDPAIRIDSRHEARQYQVVAYPKWHLNKGSMSIKLKYVFQDGTSDDFSGEHKRDQAEVHGIWKHRIHPRLFTELGLGLVSDNSDFLPLQYRIALKFLTSEQSKLDARIASRYRIPSMNDLYWVPGGNPDLEVEYGWMAELNYFGIWRSLELEIGTQFTHLNDRIIWLPQFAIWSPQNASEVESLEFYTGLKHSIHRSNLTISNRIKYRYVSAEVTQSNNTNIISGGQLPYVPKHSWTHDLTFLIYDRIEMIVRTKFQGRTYTLPDHSNDLDAFLLTDIEGRFYMESGKYDTSFFLKVANVWDTEYFLIDGYALPGTHFKAGFSINITNKKEI